MATAAPPPNGDHRDITTTTTTKKREKLYTPEVQNLMIDMMRLSRVNTPGALMAAIYHYLFGEPENVAKVMRYWFAVLHNRVAMSGARDMEANPERVIAQLLVFLSEAPAAPCIRSHQVGEDQHHLVFFMPFGCAKDDGNPGVVQPCNLMVPIVHMDPRIIHAFNTIIMDREAFTHGDEDPVFGYVTFSCFTHAKSADAAMDKYRKVFIASAVRTLVECIRGDILHSVLGTATPDSPFWNSVVPTYKQAEREARIIDRVYDSIKAIRPKAMPPVLGACFRYVVMESGRKASQIDGTRVRPGASLTAEQMRLLSYPYVDPPTDEDIKARYL